ncbi:MAG: MerR family transcriptional regulator [Candidatus Taylorbacteria bacterium]|nr:MerR family transcriptional regulator [Candidatus Taylorbacteria bacterium]
MLDLLPTDITFFRGDDFFIGLSKYEEPKLRPFHVKVRGRIHTVGDTDIAYRVINHWAQKNLLPEGCRSQNGTWRKFTTIELVWLNVIVRLRDLGLSLEKIASITKQIMKWEAESQSYPIFEYCFALALASNSDPYVIYLFDGKADIATSREIESAKTIIGSRDMLLISIKSILSQMGYSPLAPSPLLSLNRNEKKLLNEIRSDANTEVTARVKSGVISDINRTVSQVENPKFVELRNSFKQSNGFGEILLKFSEGVIQTAIVKHNERLH